MEKEMATDSNILTWKILWTEEPGRVQSMSSQRVGHYLVTSQQHAATAKSHQSCPTLCDPIDDSPSGSRPWDSPGNNTGVGCHFLLQCMKVKSESEVALSSITLRDAMDCSLPGSSVHRISQARVLEWVAIAFSKQQHSNALINTKNYFKQ